MQISNTLVTVVTVSVEVFPEYLVYQVPQVVCNGYSKQESIEVLALYPPDTQFPPEALQTCSTKELSDLYHVYCDIIYITFSPSFRSITLLRRLAHDLWPEFIKHADGEAAGVRKYRFLIAKFRDFLKKDDTLGRLFSLDRENRGPKFTAAVSFPTTMKFVLIACYLGSHNPPRLDVRYFSKSREARRRRAPSTPRKNETVRGIGPRYFELERMLAIFLAIRDEEASVVEGPQRISADILSQVSTLYSLKLLLRQTSTDLLDSRGRWKVNVGLDQIKQIARSIEFPLETYLAES